MSISVNIHPEGFRAESDPERTTVWLTVQAGSGSGGSSDAAIFLTPQRCDELIEAATAAKQLLSAGAASAVADDPYNPGPYADQRRAFGEGDAR